MNSFVLAKRSELRATLDANHKHGIREWTPQKMTDLGMHFIDVDGSPVLVQVELNVPRVLAVLGKRLVKSKSATAKMANGSLRLTIATAEGRELCAAAGGKS